LLMQDAGGRPVQLAQDDLAVLSHGEQVVAQAADGGARFLLVAGRPLNEPVARGGPFVMNSQAEIRQAYADLESGRF
jgi:redox-sensitive bicupin YhaK (pirin superfamily)